MELQTSRYSNRLTTQGCDGCDYLTEYDWACNHLLMTGKSRIKLGAAMYPGGGCKEKTTTRR